VRALCIGFVKVCYLGLMFFNFSCRFSICLLTSGNFIDEALKAMDEEVSSYLFNGFLLKDYISDHDHLQVFMSQLIRRAKLLNSGFQVLLASEVLREINC
jgi:hypothetical protein